MIKTVIPWVYYEEQIKEEAKEMKGVDSMLCMQCYS